jgi:hypothetical protein
MREGLLANPCQGGSVALLRAVQPPTEPFEAANGRLPAVSLHQHTMRLSAHHHE